MRVSGKPEGSGSPNAGCPRYFVAPMHPRGGPGESLGGLGPWNTPERRELWLQGTALEDYVRRLAKAGLPSGGARPFASRLPGGSSLGSVPAGKPVGGPPKGPRGRDPFFGVADGPFREGFGPASGDRLGTSRKMGARGITPALGAWASVPERGWPAAEPGREGARSAAAPEGGGAQSQGDAEPGREGSRPAAAPEGGGAQSQGDER